MESDTNLLGFYLWDGSPCEIRRPQEDPEGLEAVMYVAGKGFLPAPLVEVLWKGEQIPESEFKSYLLKYIEIHKK